MLSYDDFQYKNINEYVLDLHYNPRKSDDSSASSSEDDEASDSGEESDPNKPEKKKKKKKIRIFTEEDVLDIE